VGTNNANWYWVSQLYEAGAQAKLAIFDTNLHQIGPTSTLPITNLPAKDIEFGQHHAVGNHPSVSFYNNALIAYDTNAIFPLIPTSAPMPPAVPGEPLIVIDGSQILPDPRNANTGLLIYSASNRIKNIAFKDFDWNGLTVCTIDASNNIITGCWFGVDASGTNAAPNGYEGILVRGGANGNLIGGTNSLARNLISGNRHYGICMMDPGTTQNSVLGNIIGADFTGTNALGNMFANIALLANASSNRIGATDPGAGNIIAFSGSGPGIVISDSGTTNNSMRGNSIFNNAGPGIDLNNDGPTLNDDVDADIGPNNLQNFPILSSAYGLWSSTIISGSLNSTPNANFVIDFYGSPTADPTGHGEGKIWLGSAGATTDSTGNAGFSLSNTAENYAGSYISATATASSGDTSEFSLATLATNKPVAPSAEFTGLISKTTNGFKFGLTLATNFNYHIQATADLAADPVIWTDLTNFFATNAWFDFTDFAATDYAARFYRVTSP